MRNPRTSQSSLLHLKFNANGMSLAECKHIHRILKLTDQIEKVMAEVASARGVAEDLNISNVIEPLGDAIIHLAKAYTGFNKIYIDPLNRMWLKGWVDDKVESIKLKHKKNREVF